MNFPVQELPQGHYYYPRFTEADLGPGAPIVIVKIFKDLRPVAKIDSSIAWEITYDHSTMTNRYAVSHLGEHSVPVGVVLRDLFASEFKNKGVNALTDSNPTQARYVLTGEIHEFLGSLYDEKTVAERLLTATQLYVRGVEAIFSLGLTMLIPRIIYPGRRVNQSDVNIRLTLTDLQSGQVVWENTFADHQIRKQPRSAQDKHIPAAFFSVLFEDVLAPLLQQAAKETITAMKEPLLEKDVLDAISTLP
jgi:hypothetical protein